MITTDINNISIVLLQFWQHTHTHILVQCLRFHIIFKRIICKIVSFIDSVDSLFCLLELLQLFYLFIYWAINIWINHVFSEKRYLLLNICLLASILASCLPIYPLESVGVLKIFKIDVQSDHRWLSPKNLLNDCATHKRICTFSPVPKGQQRTILILIHTNVHFEFIKYYSINFTDVLGAVWVSMLNALDNKFLSQKKVCLMSTQNSLIWICNFQGPILVRDNGERSASEISVGARWDSNHNSEGPIPPLECWIILRSLPQLYRDLYINLQTYVLHTYIRSPLTNP